MLNLSAEAEMDEILTQRIKELIHTLHDGELLEEQRALAQQLPNIWPRLAPDERKLLATAKKFFNNNDLLRFAGISLGIALERCLILNWLKPVRASLHYNPGFPLNQADTELEKTLIRKYFQAPDIEGKLTIHDLIETLDNIVLRAKPPNCELKQHLLDYLNQHTYNLLHNPRNNQERKDKLNNFRDIRNHCPHFKEQPPSQADIQTMFDILLEAEDGFYQYFMGAFIK
jgi:hypothetical protein